MTATIKDVAARAGVSAKTVSRVMNGEAHVRPAVRETVLSAVAELAYRPNAHARSLSSARSYLLALLIDDAASGYAIAMQRGAMERCRRSGYHLVIETLDLADADWPTALDELARALRLDGAILAPPLSQNAALILRLDALGLPYVLVSPDERTAPRAAAVGFDEEAAAYDMTRHLLALGHREIGFVEGDPAHAAAVMRRAGFERAMRDAAAPVETGLIQPGDFSFRAGMAAGEALLRGARRPTAIFASNDDMALGVSVAALKHHIAVPDALSIAGFDDAPTARLAWPPITTVRQPTAQMGASAADILIGARLGSAGPPDRRWMSFELIIRGSTSSALRN